MVTYPMVRISCIFTAIGNHCSSDFVSFFFLFFFFVVVAFVCFHQVPSLLVGQRQHGVRSLPNSFSHMSYPALRIEPRTFILNPASLSPQPHAPIPNAEYKISLMITIGLKCPAECNS